MLPVMYRKMEVSDLPVVSELIKALYKDDLEGKPMTDAKILNTFHTLQEHPDYGTILVFEYNGQLIGYSMLINFWSNEYGGIVLSIDELYILSAFRSQGIGKNFIDYLKKSNFNNNIALELEVLPYNKRALQLYEQIGFKKSGRHHLLSENKSSVAS